jgi:hypothetical protein
MQVEPSKAQFKAVIIMETLLCGMTKPIRNEVTNVTVPPRLKSTEPTTNVARESRDARPKQSSPMMTNVPPRTVQMTGPTLSTRIPTGNDEKTWNELPNVYTSRRD